MRGHQLGGEEGDDDYYVEGIRSKRPRGACYTVVFAFVQREDKKWAIGSGACPLGQVFYILDLFFLTTDDIADHGSLTCFRRTFYRGNFFYFKFI